MKTKPIKLYEDNHVWKSNQFHCFESQHKINTE